MASFWTVVNQVIRNSDILLEVLDARFPEESRNIEVENKAAREEKQILYVLNKCDLVTKEDMEKWKGRIQPSIFVSSKERLGTTMLRNKILSMAKKDNITVGVVGYPNTGKSSVINALKGKTAAKTSSVSGYTKGLQMIRIDNRMNIIDTPGVIPFKEDDEVKLALLGSKTDVKEPEIAALKLLENMHDDEPEEKLEELAKGWNMLMKGGIPDTRRAARKLLEDWQKGRYP